MQMFVVSSNALNVKIFAMDFSSAIPYLTRAVAVFIV